MADIGFIGTGLMGTPMVERLIAAGHRVHIWNRSMSKMLPLQKLGASLADSPAAIAAQTSLIGMCMTDAAAAEAVLFGAGGVCEGGSAPTVVDFTSMAPDQAISIGEQLAGKCAGSYVDAPVSGGVAGARQGTLVIMCGGKDSSVAVAQTLFSPLASRVTHLGPMGAGQLAKLCNQHIVSTAIIATAEAFAIARSLGVDLTKIKDALEGGFADSKAFQLWGTRMATDNWEPNVGAADTMWKDVRNVQRTMQKAGLSLPLVNSVEDIFQGISHDGRGKDDLGSLVSHFLNKSS